MTSDDLSEDVAAEGGLQNKRRCNGCGRSFEPSLDGKICPTCVEIIIENDLDPDDWDQYRLQEEYDP